MKIFSKFKGKKIQKELEKNKNKDFKFEEYYYGDINIIDGFKILFSNNYTEKLCNKENTNLSILTCKITLLKNNKSLSDIIEFLQLYYSNKISNYNYFKYGNLYIYMTENQIDLYLRGDIKFYIKLCEYIHHNIIIKYIKNNIIINDTPIQTPNEYLNTLYNSINNPNKDIDILFIEENNPLELSPIIGLSISEKTMENYTTKIPYLFYNQRYIFYIELNKLSEDQIEYIINNVNYGDKLKDIYYSNINDFDIDEILN